MIGSIYQLLRSGNGAEKTNTQYTKEFKGESVAQVIDQGYSLTQAAVSWGKANNMLYG